MEDIKRIEVGNSRYPAVDIEEITIPPPYFTADREDIYMDSTVKKMDEEMI